MNDTLCNGAHCKCMNLNGDCPNHHYASCVVHNPSAVTPHTYGMEERMNKLYPRNMKNGLGQNMEWMVVHSHIPSFLREEISLALTQREEELKEVLENWYYKHATQEPDGTYTLVLQETHDWIKAKRDLLALLTKDKGVK